VDVAILGRGLLDRPPGSDVGAAWAFPDVALRLVRTVGRCRQDRRSASGLVLAVLWLVLGAAGWWVVVASLGSDRGRELRRLLEIESELTATEADRVWALIRDIFVSVLPWLMLLVVALMVSSAYSIALVARVVRTHVEHPARSGQPDVALGSVFTGAARRVPAVLGAGIVVVAVYAAGWAVGAVLVALVVLVGGGAVAIVLTAIFVMLLVVMVTAWLWGRLTLATVIAADGGHGIGVRRSWELTEGRFWFAVGRLLVTAMIAGAAGGVVNALTGFGQFLGFVVFLAMVVLLQALAFGVSIIVTTCGHLAPSTSSSPTDRSDWWISARVVERQRVHVGSGAHGDLTRRQGRTGHRRIEGHRQGDRLVARGIGRQGHDQQPKEGPARGRCGRTWPARSRSSPPMRVMPTPASGR
jgi:hypothetical protein